MPVANPSREGLMLVPMTDASGRVRELHARLCHPDADAQARLVLINHGSPPEATPRARMHLGRCGTEAAQWFLSRGYVVGFVLRRGYGETGGRLDEGIGSCSQPDFVKAGIETARDMNAASRREVTRRQWRNPHASLERWYGLGTMSGSSEGWEWFGHGGGLQGYVSQTCTVPEQDLTVCVLTNAMDGWAGFWLDGIIHVLRTFQSRGAAAEKLRDWTGRW